MAGAGGEGGGQTLMKRHGQSGQVRIRGQTQMALGCQQWRERARHGCGGRHICHLTNWARGG